MDEKQLAGILEKYPPSNRESLIPILQEIQDINGYLSESMVVEVGKYVKMPTSKIFGLSTFFNQFRFEPPAKFMIRVCRGTSCHVNDSNSLLAEFEKKYKLKPGQMSRDGMFGLEITGCMGACGIGPVMEINGDYYTEVKASDLKGIIDSYIHKEE
jgi:NADH:ubiquinone oxidoreductase subunit E